METQSAESSHQRRTDSGGNTDMRKCTDAPRVRPVFPASVK